MAVKKWHVRWHENSVTCSHVRSQCYIINKEIIHETFIHIFRITNMVMVQNFNVTPGNHNSQNLYWSLLWKDRDN
jgi:hypothetical protein